jgi:hypothetical protein
MTHSSLGERAREELRLYAVITLYLYVCFGVLVLYQDALTQADGGGAWLPHGVALVKALVIGKFLLIGRAVGARLHVAASTGAQRIVLRSLVLLVVVFVLSVAEEFIVGAIHGRSVAETLADLEHRPGLMLVAKCSLVMLIVLPLVTLEELDRALGRPALRSLLFTKTPPTRAD